MSENQSTNGNGKYVKWTIFAWAFGVVLLVIAGLQAQISSVAAQVQENLERIQDVRELILQRLGTIEGDTRVTKEQVLQIQQSIQEIKQQIR